MSSVSLYQEIEEKQIYLYKDIPREKILKGKYFSVYIVYFLFILLYIAGSAIAYYFLFQGADLATGTFPEEREKYFR